MKKETKTKLNKILFFSLLSVPIGLFTVNVASNCIKEYRFTKAETPTEYIYELKHSNSAINLTWNGYTYDSTVYVGEKRYDKVSSVEIANSLGRVRVFTENNTYTLDNTQDVAIVPRVDDTDDLPSMAYPQNFTKYPYLDYKYEFINTPMLIDTFANQNYQGIPITSVAYASNDYTIYSGIFYSNGIKYHNITLRLQALNGTQWYVNGTEYAFNSNSHSELRNLCYIANMKYDDTTVYQVDGVLYNGNYYLTTSNRWNNEAYTKLHFLANYLTPSYPNYPTATFREMFDSYNFGRIIVVDDSLKETFNLIALSISSILPILNYKIASDITLGALVLVPVTITIIIALIKLLKR